MLTILCAHKIEAKLFIDHYGLEKNNNYAGLNLFVSDSVQLILCGQGRENAEYAFTRYFKHHPSQKTNYWLNFGIVGSAQFEVGKLVQVNKIDSLELGQNQSFNLAPIIGSEIPAVHCYSVAEMERRFGQPGVFDMELATIAMLLNNRDQLERLVALKLISDGPGTSSLAFKLDAVYDLIMEKSSLILTVSDTLTKANT